MPVVQSTIAISAAPETVFALLTNPLQHPRIDGSTTLRHLRHGPTILSAGSTFGMSMRLFGVPYRVTNRVVEFEANRLIAWRHFEPQRWRYELTPVSGGTRVTETFDYSYWGTMGRRFIRTLGWPARNQQAITATLLRLKALAEAESQTQTDG